MSETPVSSDSLMVDETEQMSEPTQLDSIISLSTKKEFVYPGRVMDIIENEKSHLEIVITDASKSTEGHAHQLQSYIVYTVSFGPLTVKRRYSEFESLRICLIKEFPTLIIPPIPEKQSLRSNIATTTSNSLGITSSNSLSVSTVQTLSNNGSIAESTKSKLSSSNSTMDPLNVIEYRKRMLSVFLNRCLKIDSLTKCKFFLYFLDPETNFSDYLAIKENSSFFKTSIYQLSPFSPLDNLENQIYLTLPIPSSSDAHLFKELSNEQQFQNFISFETKFLKYEMVLNSISKVNKRLLKHFAEISNDMSELGSDFNGLSLLQDSNYVESLGKLFERRIIYMSSLCESVNLEFLDKLIELKHFTTTAKELIEYNRKKLIQNKLVEKEVYNVRSHYQRYESKEIKIHQIDLQAKKALGEDGDNDELSNEPPITDAELQTALYTKSKKPFYDKIPGVNKLNNVILRYVNDPNPDETRRNKVYNLKLRLFQLERQHEILDSEIERINKEVIEQLEEFHEWFKDQLGIMTRQYNGFVEQFLINGKESWEDVCV